MALDRFGSYTLPSVTVRNVSIIDSFFSGVGASSIKAIATCTILVVACLSCPCFFERSKTCSLSSGQSPDSLHIVTIATKHLEVEARSEAWSIGQYQQSSSKGCVIGVVYLSSALLQPRKLLERCLDIILSIC